MSKNAIETDRIAKTKGPYAQGVAVTDCTLIFTSGVIARDASGQVVGEDDIRAQTRQCIENIRHVIEAGGGRLEDLAKITVFIRKGEDYAGMNEIRREMLSGISFASSTVQTGLNDSSALIEVEAVAAVPLHRA